MRAGACIPTVSPNGATLDRAAGRRGRRTAALGLAQPAAMSATSRLTESGASNARMTPKLSSMRRGARPANGTRARYLSSTSLPLDAARPRAARRCAGAAKLVAIVHANDDRPTVSMRKPVRQRRRIRIEHDLLLEHRNHWIRHPALVHVLPAERAVDDRRGHEVVKAVRGIHEIARVRLHPLNFVHCTDDEMKTSLMSFGSTLPIRAASDAASAVAWNGCAPGISLIAIRSQCPTNRRDRA